MTRFIFMFLFVVALCYGSQAAEMRSWTGSNGKVIEAEFISFDGEFVRLKLKNGKESNVKLMLFSEKDQEYVKKLGESDNPFDDEQSGDEPMSTPELLGAPTFEGNRLNPRFWNWTPLPPNASMQIDGGVLKIVPNAVSTDKPGRLQTFGFNLKKDMTYQFDVEIKGDKKTCVQIKAEDTASKPLNLGLAESIQVDTQWKQQRLTFKSLADCPKAQISFNHFNAGHVYEIKSVSLRELADSQVNTIATERLGPEILPISTFPKGYLPNRNGSAWAGPPGSISNENGWLRMQVNRGPDDPNYTPNLGVWPFDIAKGKRYRLTFEMRSENPSVINTSVRTNHIQPRRDFGLLLNLPIDTTWRTYSFSFESTETIAKNVGTGINEFMDNDVYELRSISLREILDDSVADNGTEEKPRLGPELLQWTDFKGGRIPGGNACMWITMGSDVSVENHDDSLVMTYKAKTDSSKSPQLVFKDFSIKYGTKYELSYEIKSKNMTHVFLRLRDFDSYVPLGFEGNKPVSDEWKKYVYEFTASKDAIKGSLAFNLHELGGQYELRSISLREILD